MRHFNTAGPVNKDNMYKVDPLTRWNLEEILELIEREKYFILHAPRQTGKTSGLLALRDYLNAEGKYFAVYVNVEPAQAMLYDTQSGIRVIVEELRSSLALLGVDSSLTENINRIRKEDESGSAFKIALEYLCTTINKPIILFIDEIDSLVGETLISVLRQLRAGYPNRPTAFPASIILCGVRDIKDYRITTSTKEIVTGGSAFNIKTVSLRLGNFTRDDVINLYSQHTEETGQRFEESCYDRIMEYTDGQPWLVNALANEATHNMKANRDRSITITPEILAEAKERLILERQTHLDQLVDKLDEDRVRRVILPMILGIETEPDRDDESYCIDLGLIKIGANKALQIANKIYQEIIPREMTEAQQRNFYARFQPNWLDSEGRIDVETLLYTFKDFWCKNSEIWGTTISGYHEAAPQLVIQAFLQRVVNGGGRISREYALGYGRTDLFIEWWYQKGDKALIQNIVIEIKAIRKNEKYETVKDTAIAQTYEYTKRCGMPEAHILVFDRDNKQGWTADTANEVVEYMGIKLTIWRLGQVSGL